MTAGAASSRATTAAARQSRATTGAATPSRATIAAAKPKPATTAAATAATAVATRRTTDEAVRPAAAIPRRPRLVVLDRRDRVVLRRPLPRSGLVQTKALDQVGA